MSAIQFQKLPPGVHLFLKYRADLVISEVVNKDVFSNQDMKEAGRTLVGLSLISKGCKTSVDVRLSDLQKIFKLYHKYRASYGQFMNGKEILPCGNTQLLDLLRIGEGREWKAKTSFKRLPTEFFQDMEQIIELMPRSVTCKRKNYGTCIRGGFSEQPVASLVIACFNPNIPIHSIELLLQRGANPNTTLVRDGKRTHILTIIKELSLLPPLPYHPPCPKPCPSSLSEARGYPTWTQERDRYEQLKNVLEKYGAVEEVDDRNLD